MLGPEVSVLTAIFSFTLREDLCPLLRVGIQVFLELQQLFLINSEHRELIAHVWVGQILFRHFDRTVADTTYGLRQVVEWRFLHLRMLRVSPALLPAFCHMWQAIAIVFHSLYHLVFSLCALGEASRPEQETLQSDVHAAALKRLRLLRLVKHRLQSVNIGSFEDFGDA